MDRILTLDKSLFLWLNNELANPWLDYFFWFITWLGNGWVLALLTGIGLWFYNRSLFKHHLFFIVLAMLLSGIPIVILKLLISRPRPLAEFNHLIKIGKLYIHSLNPISNTTSFPSGHTQSAFAVAVYLSFLFWRLAPIFIIFASLVGLARIYTGVHYPLDVLVGAVIGSLFSVIIWKWQRKKNLSKSNLLL
jgi:undecaprenyl-diphosphatase